MAYHAIENHGIVGDLSTVALVAFDGTIDFMCFPRFDSPTVFASLLDDKKGGFFRVAPMLENAGQKQMYLPETNVLLTRVLSEEGVSEITDFMVIAAGSGGHRLVRRALSVRGEIHYQAVCNPRFDYARAGWTVERTSDGVVFTSEGQDGTRLRLRSSVPLDIGDEGVTCQFMLKGGESASFILEGADAPASSEPFDVDGYVTEALRATVRYWHRWISQCNYKGRWWEMVNRSALVLKLLTSREYGAPVASATLGVPERLGGPLNWDYRYCWVRDASFVMRTFLHLGYTEEPAAFMDWISKQCCISEPSGLLEVMYRVDGRTDLKEHVLEHLEGYQGSYPVRVGNGAADQMQLDIYGELMEFVNEYDKKGQLISIDVWRSLSAMMDWLCEHWNQPDDGIWEVRSGREEFLYSRVMCWVALDRALRVARRHSFPAPVARWRESRNAIFENVCSEFWDADRRCFVGRRGSTSVDAAALFMPMVGFIAPTDPRWLSTLEVIEEELVSDSLVYRYRHRRGEPDAPEIWEGTFCMCSFWYTQCLALAERLEESRLYFEKMLGYANPLGLYSEELGFRGDQLGNFPQAFTHFALINAAGALDRALSSHWEEI